MSSGHRGVALLGLLALAAACLPSAANTRWGADYFPNVVLTTHEGRQVRLYDDLLKGKAVAINVIYTRCTDECPLETARLAQVRKLLGDRVGRDLFFYSISIDPEHDTPAVLKAYAKNFGADAGPGWLFLTGSKDDIRLVARKLGLSRTSDALNRDGHAAHLMLGNVPKGQWMRQSAVDNPDFLAAMIGSFFGWKVGGPGYASAQQLKMGAGERLFRSRCSACHTLGEGDRIGPDLAGVLARRDHGWVARYISAPDRLQAERDPAAVALAARFREVRMPNLNLGSDDVTELLAFLRTQDVERARAPAQAPAHDHSNHKH